MIRINSSKLLILAVLLFCGFGTIYAQADASTPSGRPNPQANEDLPDSFKENLAKRRLKTEEEDYQELIRRSEEAVKISEELTKTVEATNKISGEDAKKVVRLEKVVNKIRQDLGAKDEGDDSQDVGDGRKQTQPSTIVSALKTIKKQSSDLLSELKKTTRYSVSVISIQSSNTILKLVRFIRFNKN